jgi:hypothetical protein
MEQAIMEPAIVRPNESPSTPLEPNQFELLGRGISVSFSRTSITGDPLFRYQDACREVNARGDDIRQVETEIGTLVTVTLEPDADAGSLLFTVLIPRARLEGAGSELRISTEGIITRSRFPFSPTAMDDQLQEYRTVTMKGQASFVVS